MSQPENPESVVTEEISPPRAVETIPCQDCHGDGCELCGQSGTLTLEVSEPQTPGAEQSAG